MPESDLLKQVMDRWKLVGDSTINFCIVFELWMTSDLSVDLTVLNDEKMNRYNKSALQEGFK
jgi:hypothetical protein